VKLLLAAGADVNMQGGKYGSALQAACFDGCEKVVEQLLKAGADVNMQGGKYGNALQAASLEGHENVVKQLLKVGARFPPESKTP
jgi:ankyrin repeat protein